MKKFIIALLGFVFGTLSVQAQHIEGTVTSPTGEHLSGIAIRLNDSSFGAVSDDSGRFALRNVTPGVYSLVITGLGYEVARQIITVSSGKTTTLSLVLKPAIQILETVTVKDRQYRTRDGASLYAARLPLTNLENPQVINAVPNQLIVEQASTDLNSIMRNIPGVTKGWSSASAYYTSRGSNTRNYFRNGVAGYVTADVDPANIEQLVALKGPSGTLFGSSLVSFGGVFNRITKRPFDTTHVEIGYQAGSYELSRFTADINTPLTADRRVLLRLNAAHHYEGSFQDAGFVRSTFLAPSLLYRVNERLTLSVDMEMLSKELGLAQQFVPYGSRQPGTSLLGAANPSQLPLDFQRSFSNNTIMFKTPNLSFFGKIDYRLSDQWTSQTNVTRSQGENTGNYLLLELMRGDSTLTRSVIQYPISLVVASQIQQNFVGDFTIGPFRNRIVAGLDFYRNSSSISSNALNGRGGRPAFDTLSLTRPTPTYSLISPASISTRLDKLAPTATSTNQSTYAAYVSDVIDVTDRLSAMVSLRVDRFINGGTLNPATNVTTGKYAQTAVSPKLGLVYQLLKDRLSLFGNYMNGFQNTAGADVNKIAFKPQHANQLEGGVKVELKRDVLSATVSYYAIRVENTLRSDLTNSGFSIQDGSQYSRGVEVDVLAKPTAGLSLLAGFAYNDSKLTSADETVNGLRPVDSGPAQTANFWASYTVPTRALRGLGVGVGGNYAGENLIVNSTNRGQFQVNAYTLVSSALFYNCSSYRLGLNMDNVTNQHYYTGGYRTITPGMPRRVILSTAIRF